MKKNPELNFFVVVIMSNLPNFMSEELRNAARERNVDLDEYISVPSVVSRALLVKQQYSMSL